MRAKQDFLDALYQSGIIAIMRADHGGGLRDAAAALAQGGVRIVEVSLTTPGALSVIEQVASTVDGVTMGAGTVVDEASCTNAISAGAQFIVSPGYSREVVSLCRDRGIAVIPGAFTPTEILHAWQGGADLVKVFPASIGGPQLIEALHAPLPNIPLAAVGGVTLENVARFFAAGAKAVGLGSGLMSKSALLSKDFEAITSAARRFVDAVAAARTVRA